MIRQRSAAVLLALALLGQTDADHKSGKAAAGAEVEPTLATLGQAEDLQGIRDMAGPDIGQRRRGDEVLRRLPAPELGDQKGEALLCFT